MCRLFLVLVLHFFSARGILRAILLLVILLNISNIQSQNQHIELIPAAKSTNLPEIDINCLVQDSAGFLWIGTWKGLFRYDGRKVVNFSQQFSSKIGRKISALYLDNEGKLWIGTYSEGLFIYNPKNQQIISYESINNIKTGNIINISGGSDNKVFVACYEGVFTFDLSKAKFDPQTLVYAESGNSYRLTMAFEDSKGSLWIGSDQGLLRYNRITKKIENTSFLKGIYIHKIQELANGWIAVSSIKGTDMFDEINGEIMSMNSNPIASNISVEKGESYACLIPKSQPDQLWIGLPSGLMIVDIISGSIISRPAFNAGKENISFRVESLFEDRQGIIWVGTNNGLYKYDPNHKPFNVRTLGENTLGVVSLAPSGKNSFWAGTTGKGVYLIELGNNGQPIANRRLLINKDIHNSPLKNDIFSMASGFNGDIWISTKGSGIVHVKKYAVSGNDVIALATEEYNEANGLADNHVMTLYRDSRGILWGGCWSNGLICYSEETKMFMKLKGNLARELKKYPIVKIIESGPNRYYLGTRGNGMIQIETNSARDSIVKMDKFLNKPGDSTSICNNFISDFVIMPGNNLWIATEDGISILKASDNKFTNIGPQNGLQSAVVQSIIAVSSDELWAATENGLSKIILRNGMPEQIRNYNHFDGLEISFFNTSCSMKSGNGWLYLGGKEGICYFNPLQITDSKSSPSVVITQISLFNEVLVAGQEYEGLQILKYSSWNLNSIKLRYFQNTLSFSFSGMDFSAPEKISYAYQMEGIDKNWIYTSTPECYYPRLKHGKYTLKVKCSNSDGIWNDEITTLEIKILPPWWYSGYAYAVYFLLFLVILYFSYRLITYRQRLTIKQMEQQQEIEMYDMRMRFYTNISHEFRTPLTLIMGLTGRLRINDDPEKRADFYEKIDRNSKILLRLITDLMDLRKIEKEEIRLRRDSINPSQFFRQSCESFVDLFSTKGLEFKYTDKIAGKDVFISGDPVRLESIVYNLLSNAFKYTNKNGSVESEISLVTRPFNQKSIFQFRYRTKESREYLAFKVIDTGIGMTRSQVRNIFNKFQGNPTQILSESSSTSYGIGLLFTKSLIELHHGFIEVESENNKGTTVSVYLPCTVNAANLPANEIPASESILLNSPIHVANTLNEKISRKGDEKIILVIDDNQEVRTLLRDILSPVYQIAEATDGLEGWEKAAEIVPDLIISDILMPGMDGNVLCEKIKSSNLTNHIPVILLTALPTSADRIKGLKHGADSYIPKPFEAEHLLVRIEKLISSRNLLKEKYMKDFLVKPEKNTEPEANPSSEYISKIKKYIEQNITEPDYDVADLCRDLGTSRMQLYRKLKAIVGYSANELIRKIRLHKAAELLLRGDLNIAQVTYEVGFSDLQYFRMCFKDEFELTPSQYIRANTKDEGQTAQKIDPFDQE
ncbi:MAG: response regulator [Lentimicrobium sp.]|nr:response regulator [Lentimicrobium sp.]